MRLTKLFVQAIRLSRRHATPAFSNGTNRFGTCVNYSLGEVALSTYVDGEAPANRRRFPSTPFQTAPEIDDNPRMTGNGQSPKVLMYADSRKAQRDRYAHHRADLMFSRHGSRKAENTPWSATLHEGTEPVLLTRERVRAGIIGFVPAAATAGS